MAKEKLLKSQLAKDDEFYTLYDDIAAEVSLYKEQLRGKRIICPCDWDENYDEIIVYKNDLAVAPTSLLDKGGSIKTVDINATKARYNGNNETPKCNFVKFLVSHAENYGIASISASGYNPKTNEGVKFQDVDYSKYDLVITNPPFSLFREFIDTMFAYNVKFLVIGPQNAITYRETFKFIQSNEMWLGYHYHLTGFQLADGTILKKNDSLPRCCCWFTNLDVSYRHDKIILTEKYNSLKNPSYYNYNAIDISKTKDIPYNWDGEMGVPITFLQKYNPEQFKIIGKGVQLEKTRRFQGDKATLWIEKNGKPFKAPFERIIIKNKEVKKYEN